jgi:hypothetical protein
VFIGEEGGGCRNRRSGAGVSDWCEVSDDFDKSFAGIKALYDLKEKRFEPPSQLCVRCIAESHPYNGGWPVAKGREGRKVFIFREDGESILTGKFKNAMIIEC